REETESRAEQHHIHDEQGIWSGRVGRGDQKQGQDRESQPRRREGQVSIIVRQPSAQRTCREGRDVRGNDQEACLERLLVEDELEIQAQQKEDGAESDRVENLGEEATGELADAQEFQIEERMGMPPLQEDEGREAGGREGEKARDR